MSLTYHKVFKRNILLVGIVVTEQIKLVDSSNYLITKKCAPLTETYLQMHINF